jgi:hypothetical protein
VQKITGTTPHPSGDTGPDRNGRKYNANLLRLSHQQLIEAKLRAREKEAEKAPQK